MVLGRTEIFIHSQVNQFCKIARARDTLAKRDGERGARKKLRTLGTREKIINSFQAFTSFRSNMGHIIIIHGRPPYSNHIIMGIQGFTRVFNGLQGDTWVFKGLQGCTWVCMAVSGVFQGLQGYSRVHRDIIQEYSWVRWYYYGISR